jgi:hypothetical protein
MICEQYVFGSHCLLVFGEWCGICELVLILDYQFVAFLFMLNCSWVVRVKPVIWYKCLVVIVCMFDQLDRTVFALLLCCGWIVTIDGYPVCVFYVVCVCCLSCVNFWWIDLRIWKHVWIAYCKYVFEGVVMTVSSRTQPVCTTGLWGQGYRDCVEQVVY